MDEALHDDLAGHGADGRAADAGGEEGDHEDAGRSGAEQRHEGMVGGLDLGDVGVALVEGGGGHHDHGHVDQPGDGEGDGDFDVGVAQQHPPLGLVAGRSAVLREA